MLVRLRGSEKSKRRNWLLIKHRDEFAVAGEDGTLAAEDRSVASGRTMAEIAAGQGNAATAFMTTSPTKSVRARRAPKTDSDEE
ncbi:hypothetical protein ABTK13_21180, partial [Acinetobacter baumannii]